MTKQTKRRSNKRRSAKPIQFSMFTDSVRAALAEINRIATTKSALPVLACVHMDAKKGKVHFSGTNLEAYISMSSGATVTGEGAFCLPASKLQQVASEWPAEHMKFHVDRESMQCYITSGTNNKLAVKMRVTDPKEFPQMPSAESSAPSLAISPSSLDELIGNTFYAAATDDARPSLINICIDVWANGEVRARTTDAFRLASATTTAKVTGVAKKDAPQRMLLPAKLARIVQRAFCAGANEASEMVSLTLPVKRKDQEKLVGSISSPIVFKTERMTIVIHQPDLEYPDIDDAGIIPADKDITGRIRVERTALVKALRAANTVCSGGMVTLSFEKGDDVNATTLVLSGSDDEVGSIDLPLDASTSEQASNVVWGLSIKFLRETLARFDCDTIEFRAQNFSSNAVIVDSAENDASRLHLIMVMRLQNASVAPSAETKPPVTTDAEPVVAANSAESVSA